MISESELSRLLVDTNCNRKHQTLQASVNLHFKHQSAALKASLKCCQNFVEGRPLTVAKGPVGFLHSLVGPRFSS